MARPLSLALLAAVALLCLLPGVARALAPVSGPGGAGFAFRPWSARVLQRLSSTSGSVAHAALHSRHAERARDRSEFLGARHDALLGGKQGEGPPEGPPAFAAPLDVAVVLVGLDGRGERAHSMDATRLEALLNATLPTRRPVRLGGHSEGTPLGARLYLNYRVTHARAQRVHELERELGRAMVYAGEESVPALSRDKAAVEGTLQQPAVREALRAPACLPPPPLMPLLRARPQTNAQSPSPREQYDVEASGHVEAVLDSIYADAVGNAGTGTAALLVLSPDKRAMDPRDDKLRAAAEHAKMRPARDEGGYAYRYRYTGGGRTAAWVGAGDYAVVDLSAGPCALGRAGEGEQGLGGAVGPLTLPRVADYHMGEAEYAAPGAPQEAADAQLRGRVATVVRSAVEHLFAPDVVDQSSHTTHTHTRVLVPLVVFTDHARFDPLDPKSDFPAGFVNVSALEAQLEALALPGQHIMVVPRVESMADHPAIAAALAAATAAGGADQTGAHVAKRRPRVHGARLLEELREARDVLTRSLLESDDVAGSAAADFFDPRDVGGGRTRGTHVLPIYLFSCVGLPRGTAMDGEGLVASEPDVVAVLQTAEESLPLSFVTQGQAATVDARAPLAPIVAGVARALAGAADPHERWSAAHGERREAWLWAAGAHPFGPFAPPLRLAMSRVLVAAAQRSAAIAKADAAAAKVSAALAHIEAFVDEHLRAPLGGRVGASEMDGADADGDVGARLPSVIDALYHDPDRPDPPLPHATVAAVERDLDSMEERFVALAETLWSRDLREAHAVSSALLTAASSFERYAADELEAARSLFQCCSLRRRQPQPAGQRAALFLGGGLVLLLLLLLLGGSGR